MPPVACPDSAAAAAEVKDDPYLASLAEWDNNTAPIPWPTIPVAEGAEREELRVRLMDLAKKEAAVHQSLLEKELRKWEGPLARIALDEVQAAPHPHAELMRREEASCFRQFMRLGIFLLKLQKRAKKVSKMKVHPGMLMKINRRKSPAPGPRSTVRRRKLALPGRKSLVRRPKYVLPGRKSLVQWARPPGRWRTPLIPAPRAEFPRPRRSNRPPQRLIQNSIFKRQEPGFPIPNSQFRIPNPIARTR